MFDNIKVVKRDGKKVDFDGTKIAIAIKKGFDSVQTEENPKYTENDVNKVFNLVISDILKLNVDKIKIEEIQDMIELRLKNTGYQDVYESFSEYRERRSQSRKIFFEEKQQHKFLKALEDLSLKTNNINGHVKNSLETMVDYGSTISKEFAKAYMVKKKISDEVESGEIYIHDLNFMPVGTTTSMQIDLEKLFSSGFNAKGIHIREPKDIMSYSALAVQVMTIDEKEQHGCQSIPNFDYYMAPGVLKTFKKQFKQTLDGMLEYSDFGIFAATNGIEREIEKIESISFDISIFDKYSRDSEQLKRMFRIAYKISLDITKNKVAQAMEAFVHNINVITSNGVKEKSYPTINLGTDISSEGRIVTYELLNAIDDGVDDSIKLKSPLVIFKIKEEINYKEKDINYDLYKKAIEIANRKGYPYFSFLDASFNKKYYIQGDKNTEIAYNATNMRVIDNVIDQDKEITPGRGNLSYTTINLPRIAIKNSNRINILNNESKEINKKISNEKQFENFFNELEDRMNMVKDELLDRFEIQGNKKAFELPFLIKEGIWIDGEKVKDEDKIRKVIKQGTLSIGFIGLEETLQALLGQNRVESKDAEKLGIQIVKFMRNKTDEFSNKYNLNFTLIGIDDDELCEKFITMDKAIYGKLEGITDKKAYTNAFYIAQNTKIAIEEKIKIEATYHTYTNGGHILKIKLNGKDRNSAKIENILKIMKENNVGYAKIIK